MDIPIKLNEEEHLIWLTYHSKKHTRKGISTKGLKMNKKEKHLIWFAYHSKKHTKKGTSPKGLNMNKKKGHLAP